MNDDVIYKTTDYSMFVQIPWNRKIEDEPSRFERLRKGLENGVIHSAAFVTPIDKSYPARMRHTPAKSEYGKFAICDGAGRFTIAKERGLVFPYQVKPNFTETEVKLLNSSATVWNGLNYITSEAKKGSTDYQKLYDYMQEFGLKQSAASFLLSGSLAKDGGNMKIKAGTFEVRDEAHARKVGKLILSIGEIVPYANQRCLALALALAMRVEEFKPAYFLQKVKSNRSMLTKCATADQYLELIQKIYNYKSQKASRIALVFKVNQLRS